MKYVKYILVGFIFGLTLAKGEVISWFRIYEMFRFESFHMYGVIGSAVVLGILLIQIMKRSKMKSISGGEILFKKRPKAFIRYIFGGSIFGMGWAITGACPGPMYILVGYGYLTILVVLVGAVLGAYLHGLVYNKLPQ